MRVSITRKKFLSAIHGYLSADLYGPMKLKTMQKLECAAAYFLDGQAPTRETLQNTITEAVEAAGTNYGVAEANE